MRWSGIDRFQLGQNGVLQEIVLVPLFIANSPHSVVIIFYAHTPSHSVTIHSLTFISLRFYHLITSLFCFRRVFGITTKNLFTASALQKCNVQNSFIFCALDCEASTYTHTQTHGMENTKSMTQTF